VHLFDYGFSYGIYFLVWGALGFVKLFAFVDALSRPAQAYDAADKQTKTAWLWITGLALVAHFVFPALVGLFSFAGIIAAFVYLLDVRPALIAVTRRR